MSYCISIENKFGQLLGFYKLIDESKIMIASYQNKQEFATVEEGLEVLNDNIKSIASKFGFRLELMSIASIDLSTKLLFKHSNTTILLDNDIYKIVLDNDNEVLNPISKPISVYWKENYNMDI